MIPFKPVSILKASNLSDKIIKFMNHYLVCSETSMKPILFDIHPCKDKKLEIFESSYMQQLWASWRANLILQLQRFQNFRLRRRSFSDTFELRVESRPYQEPKSRVYWINDVMQFGTIFDTPFPNTHTF